MNLSILWRSALCQAIGVAVLGAATGLTLPHSFFETWGWLIGPVSWIVATLVTVRLVRLPLVPTLIGAVLTGAVSLIFVIIGIHWLGAALAIVLFALWCGRLGARHRTAAA